MRSILLLACVALCLPAPVALTAGAEPEPPPSAPTAEPLIRKIGPDLYQVGTVVLDARARAVRCKGRVNMDEGGPIELLACLPRGKTHETILTLDVAPMDLQLALLLLDLAPGRNPAVRYPPESPDGRHPPGDPVIIRVRWSAPAAEDGEPVPRTARAESLLFNVQTQEPAKEARWAFLGSRFVDGRFGADIDGSLVTTFHDPLAILELADETANDDVYFHVNKGLCPPVGTPVELVIQAPPREAEEPGPPDAAPPAEGAG